MANKSIFNSTRKSSIPVTNTVNKAGGRAYDLGAEGSLAQYVVTGTFNQTFYASANEQVEKVIELANQCSDEFIAQAAVYGHRVARMKDTPALLANVLANRGEKGLALLRAIFPRVISGTKMLRNFCQILRSGKCGRKSFGSAVKRMIVEWLQSQDADNLFKGSVGNDPSLADVIKMVHPKPVNKAQEAFYAWLIGKTYNKRYLSPLLKQFENFKQGKGEVPEVDFRMLTALSLTTEQWSDIARNASWNTLRMNLNTFARHGCYNDATLVKVLAEKLRDAESVRKSNAFPYQLLTTYQNTEGQIPAALSLALQDALEIATQNVPSLKGETIICIDVSGSMQDAVTGVRAGSTTKTKRVDVAALMASSIMRVNPNATVIPFDTSVKSVYINPRDSVMTNAAKLSIRGGGTDCSCALRHLNSTKAKADTVIFVSDNESWYTPASSAGFILYGRANAKTNMVNEWEAFRQRNRKAKLICVDIAPGSTTQAPDSKDILNVGGFSDAVFEVVANFVNHDNSDFAKIIKDSVTLGLDS